MSTVTRILGVDPGGTTGVVLARLTDKHPVRVDTTFEDKNFLHLCGFLEEVIPHMDLVVCERFVPRATRFVADAPSACEPIGVIKYLTALNGTKLVLPIPSARKQITDDTMGEANYWITGQEHSRQALKHVLSYAVKELRHKPTIERLFPR